jgi:hypothetical protein
MKWISLHEPCRGTGSFPDQLQSGSFIRPFPFLPLLLRSATGAMTGFRFCDQRFSQNQIQGFAFLF